MRKFYAFFLFSIIFAFSVSAQTNGDYRSAKSGLWSDNMWEKYVGGSWDDNGGAYYAGPSTVGSGVTVTITYLVAIAGTSSGAANAYTVTNNGDIVINNGGNVYIGYSTGGFPPAEYYGHITGSGDVTNNTGGDFRINYGSVTIDGVFKENGGDMESPFSNFTINGTYDYAENGGAMPSGLTWGASSVLKLSGITNSCPAIQSDSYNDLECANSGLSSNLSLDPTEIAKFTNVNISHTGSYSAVVEGGSLTTISGNLTIGSNGKLLIPYDAKLTVNGTTTCSNNNNLIIKSTSSGTGSFLSGGNPNGTLERYVSGDSWHLIGPPNNSLNASPAFYTGYMQTWADGNPGSWTVQEGNPALTRGFGAAYYFIGSNFTADLTGQLMGDAMTVSSLGNAGGADDGFHLLANPFPCGVDLDNCTVSANISSTYQVYNGSSYVTLSGNIMPVSQGFFVEVDAGASGQSFGFTTSAKVHSNNNISKSADAVSDMLKFSLTDDLGKSNDELIIRFNENATNQYDSKYDGHKIMGNVEAGEIMAQITNDEFACVLGIPFPEEETTVPVNFKKGDASEYTLSLIENNISNMVITLEDTQTGFVSDITTNPIYVFTAEESVDGRFILHFKSATAVNEFSENDDVKIWNYKDIIFLQQDNPVSGDLYIYNASGQMVYSQGVVASKLQKITLNNTKGIYMIKFITKENSYSQKIIK